MLRLIFFVLIIRGTSLVFSQCISSDLVQNLNESSTAIVNNYLDEVNVASTLNRGTLEIKNYPEDEHPYFLINEWATGSVIYDEVFYPNIPVKYDIVNDVLITKNSLGVAYRLRSDKVKSFNLFNRTFINHNYGKLNESQFFEVVHCGQVSLYQQYSKEYKEIVEYPRVRKIYEIDQAYVLFKDDVFYKLGRKNSILKPLEDQKKALRAFIKKENLNSSEMKDQFFPKITEQYNSLIENQ